MSRTKVAKVTISLPKELLELTDRLARERDVTRSGLIAELLEKEEEARVQALMADGYKEIAEENRSLAEESFPMVAEDFVDHVLIEKAKRVRGKALTLSEYEATAASKLAR